MTTLVVWWLSIYAGSLISNRCSVRSLDAGALAFWLLYFRTSLIFRFPGGSLYFTLNSSYIKPYTCTFSRFIWRILRAHFNHTDLGPGPCAAHCTATNVQSCMRRGHILAHPHVFVKYATTYFTRSSLFNTGTAWHLSRQTVKPVSTSRTCPRRKNLARRPPAARGRASAQLGASYLQKASKRMSRTRPHRCRPLATSSGDALEAPAVDTPLR